MSFVDRLRYASNNVLATRTGGGINGHGLTGLAVDKGERYAAALAFGAAKGYYRDRFVAGGQPLDLWIGGGLTLGAALLQMWTGGYSEIAPHAERIGDAGVMSYLGSIGAHWGNKKAGRTVQVIESGRPAGALPAGSTPILGDILGAIPPVSGGTFLTAEEMARGSGPR